MTLSFLHILDPNADILLITATYLIKSVTNVLPLTKTLDSFDVEERLPDDLMNQCPNVTVVRDTVARLDAKNKKIITSSGKIFAYQKLCLCTGAKPDVIAETNPHVLWIRDTESVCQFQARIADAKRITIIGNGGIATEMVYEITGVEILWVIRDKHMTATFIDPGAAEFFRPELSKQKKIGVAPLKRRKYTVDKVKGKSTVLGGALGPDWHENLELKGDNNHRVSLEVEVEVARILEPKDVKRMGKGITKLNNEEGTH
ncbi:Pyridine nucleotide-disulfide oxidoreductase domain-containing protein 1 [Halocaridina rubra]|uniref:Pyridine nucleotide-disulfide oxidoreductase domain-containing protein 1 n=1 Tax=Halocaridina rubra TaxID=373956 RepID=A0AAN8X902_HALRR